MKIASDAYYFLVSGLALLIAMIVLLVRYEIAWLNYPIIAVSIYILLVIFFFRDPDRRIPDNPQALISPADGRVIAVDDKIPEYFSEFKQRVSIFLSMLDVHINRIPIAGKIQRLEYHKGKFLPAFREKASELNEHTVIVIKNVNGKIGLCQRAGAVARRIIYNIKLGDKVNAGERFGLIRFGSRVDMYLPENMIVHSRPKDKVRAGETIIAEFKKV